MIVGNCHFSIIVVPKGNERQIMKEIAFVPQAGWLPLAVCCGMLASPLPAFLVGSSMGSDIWIGVAALVSIPTAIAGIIGLTGLMAIAPNEARVLLLFGDYKGTANQSGFFWVNPFFTKKKISLRVRNFETGATTTPEQKDAAGNVTQHKQHSSGKPSKVNDRDGNPIEMSAVVVWKVTNTAEAMFEVDDYEHYVAVQSEAALRNLATRYPYDSEDHEVSLRGNTSEISDQLRADIDERLDKAGVTVIEARISHLAYAAEIAAAMLQRQQAGAIVAARTKIVDGAVGMVEMALQHLQRDEIVQLSDDQKASLVSNLLVVLCSDRHAQPVVNTN
jgi:regulator of protease activity HflC (stomatin/prohibitin superfamily)